MAKDQKLNFGDEIAYQLRLARKRRWNLQEEKRILEEIELQSYLTNLILKDRESQLLQEQNAGSTEPSREVEKTVETKSDKYLSDLNNMFATLDSRRKVSWGLAMIQTLLLITALYRHRRNETYQIFFVAK